MLTGHMSLEMIYHPELAQTWHYYQYIIFFLSLTMIIFTIYVILKKSTLEMGVYKVLLINELIWSLLFDIMLTVWQPVVLMPFFMAYTHGLAQIFGPKGIYSMFIITFFCYVGLLQSIYVALAYRVAWLYTPNEADSLKKWVKIAIGTFVILQTVFFSEYAA